MNPRRFEFNRNGNTSSVGLFQACGSVTAIRITKQNTNPIESEMKPESKKKEKKKNNPTKTKKNQKKPNVFK